MKKIVLILCVSTIHLFGMERKPLGKIVQIPLEGLKKFVVSLQKCMPHGSTMTVDTYENLKQKKE